MTSKINQAILKLSKRAEKNNQEHLINTFVDIGPILLSLQNPDHQILYGRRGTGKTHALKYLDGLLAKEGNLTIYIDMRQIGSNGGIYSDSKIPIPERGSRLLKDVYVLIHDGILDFVLENDDKYDLSIFGPLLDELKVVINDIEIVGNYNEEYTDNRRSENQGSFSTSVSLPSGLSAGLNTKSGSSEEKGIKKTITGQKRNRVSFTTVTDILKRLNNKLDKARIVILLDEWAEIPLSLQPYLADLMRKTILPIQNMTVIIAAIEKRTNFKIDDPDGYIGFETGADISTSFSLDDFMVFDNNSDRAIEFFKQLLYKHINEALDDEHKIENINQFIKETFTNKKAFEELVRAAEGIPRDAINILAQAAMKSLDKKISIPQVRESARVWYMNDKEASVNSKPDAKHLLRWIIDEVIAERNSRAFLLSSDTKDSLIEYLYDNRIIHLIKQNISSKDISGQRYNVYAIDYGAYVHLINTSQAVQGLFQAAESDGDNDSNYVAVPVTDYRSIRRAILDLDTYKK